MIHSGNPGRLITCLLLFSILAALQVHGQRPTTGAQRTQGGVNRGTTGAGGTRALGGGGLGGSASRQYYSGGMIGEALVSADPESRRLIVITDDETSQYISQVITNLDRPKPQVLIKVVFLEVTHRDNVDVGVEGTYRHSYGDNASGEVATSFGLAQQTSGGFYRIIDDNVEVTLRALAEAGRTEVLSRPSILARNNQLAVIVIGKEVPFITNVRFDTVGGQINTVQYQDVGIILRVTPFITDDGQVEMIIAPEISSLTEETVPISETVDAPVIAKRSAETVVVTQHGKTVVIGGMMENNRSKLVRKIPLLGDIPGLGALFRRTITDDRKTELLIFLTPYVVQRPSELARASEVETDKTQLAPRAFSEQELEKFLDGIPMKANPPPTRQQTGK